MEFSLEKAKEMLSSGMGQAKDVMKDRSKVEELLQQLEVKVKDIPFAGSVLADIPLMAAMIKSYITREYSVVSPKVIALLISAVIYLVAGKDLIPDKVPVAGYLDDIAVFTLALKLAEPELKAFAEWRDAGKPAVEPAADADEDFSDDIELPEGMPEEA